MASRLVLDVGLFAQTGASVNLDEISANFPNGFHDALLNNIEIDYKASTARLHVDIWIGDLDKKAIEEREKYRPAVLTLRGLAMFVIDPPIYDRTSERLEPVGIDGGPGQFPNGPVPLPKMDEDVFLYWFYVSDWNSCIRVAAKEASFEWAGESWVME